VGVRLGPWARLSRRVWLSQRAWWTGTAGMRRRTLLSLACVLLGFAIIAARLVLLALVGPQARSTPAEPLASTSRPDIVDRQGRLLATDMVVHSLYADPALILDLDEAAEKLSPVLDLDAAELRRLLADRGRRFAWVARGLSPRQAKRIHDLGLPGFAFRRELKRFYPLGALTGHCLGSVNVDNRGIAGIERMIDEAHLAEPGQGAEGVRRPPVELSLEIGVQHAVATELKEAVARYSASGAAGLVLDADSGEVLAAVSLPEVDPMRAADWLGSDHADRLLGGTFELGSIFKTLTVAMALETGTADLDKIYDVRQPLVAPPYTITDLHPQGRPLSVRDVFLHSSNVGAGMMALEVGAERQRAFLDRLGLLQPMRTEAGGVAAPQLPRQWGRSETITIGYGYGLALAPLQFAAAFASLINGGNRVVPTFWHAPAGTAGKAPLRVVSAATSAKLREILRLNVTSAAGTGRRADAQDYRVGGKTGTAEVLGRGGYRESAVIATFVGAFPMDAPRYVTLVSLFEPQSGDGRRDHNTAGLNAAPVTARIVARIAPLLGVLPRLVETAEPAAFDAPRPGQ
jgi:cell division protein FtsI (penicillin-binding protein 3)